MIESRCGILCNECDYKKKMNCKGCLEMDNPFWGECNVKKCCENKKLEHCGLCDEFPCNEIVSMSYDGSEGDNGARIEQCKKWVCKSEE